jgi:hypothetical protein
MDFGFSLTTYTGKEPGFFLDNALANVSMTFDLPEKA